MPGRGKKHVNQQREWWYASPQPFGGRSVSKRPHTGRQCGGLFDINGDIEKAQRAKERMQYICRSKGMKMQEKRYSNETVDRARS